MFETISRRMLAGGPLMAILVSIAAYQSGLPGPAACCAAVALTCAIWWIFETLHLAIVGLVPFVMLPLLGVVDHETVAAAYGDKMILLLLGGFFLSAAMQRTGAHRRIALTMVRAVGGRGGRRLVLGFMLATGSLSMWISNTATMLMMLPIALAVLSQTGEGRLRTPLLLGMAYAASVGGMATPIGTPPNVIFMGVYESRFGESISFLHWMRFGLPITFVLMPIIWWWVTRRVGESATITMPEVGPWRPSEKRVMVLFALAAGAWVFRADPGGGWSGLLPFEAGRVGDETVALGISLLLFLTPAGESLSTDDESLEVATSPADSTSTSAGSAAAGSASAGSASAGSAAAGSASAGSAARGSVANVRLLDWPTAMGAPWGILLMFGGGLALAEGFEASGLSRAIGEQLTVVSDAPTWVIVLSVCLLVTFLTEITSSTATATLLMPILAELAVATDIDPRQIMIPGTISASCAFMLPVATAPNVIVFGAGGIRTDEMARMGLLLNFIAAGVITAAALVLD